MKKWIAAAAVLGALALAVPAHADPYHGPDRGYDAAYRDGGYRDRDDYRPEFRSHFSRDDLFRLERRIDWGFRSGALTRREAAYLSDQLQDLRLRARFYWQTGGMSWRERQDLDARYDRLSFQIRREMHDDDHAWGGYPERRY